MIQEPGDSPRASALRKLQGYVWMRRVYLIEDELKAETTRVSPPRHGQSIAPIVGDEASDDDVASESIQLPWISLVCIDQNESRKMSLADPWSTRKQSVGRDLQSCQKISAKACPGHKQDRNIFRSHIGQSLQY